MTKISRNTKRETKKNGWFYRKTYKALSRWRKHEKASTHHVMWWWPNEEDRISKKKILTKFKNNAIL